MKTLYLNRYNRIVVDKDTDIVSTPDAYDRYYINDIILAEEPMHVVCGIGDDAEKLDIETGDILMYFRPNDSDVKHKLVVFKSKEFAENIEFSKQAEQERKEKWAAEKAKCEGTCECCDCCADACPA